ncbi:hypothetical protein BZA05DRAFT_385032 [Tricharina praecox]|uniref:uncharacterized protein n=1 Tax=Tricharina praecox TaxID=43433 RepID=UPI0022205F8A|nr:uncharacterized protein BZA05DRAFT_385032 [Tricharina praecox]KAI5857851.1 hypothetical protein BZA05DRAFT_385032 [Tricharina praecox]
MLCGGRAGRNSLDRRTRRMRRRKSGMYRNLPYLLPYSLHRVNSGDRYSGPKTLKIMPFTSFRHSRPPSPGIFLIFLPTLLPVPRSGVHTYRRRFWRVLMSGRPCFPHSVVHRICTTPSSGRQTCASDDGVGRRLSVLLPTGISCQWSRVGRVLPDRARGESTTRSLEVCSEPLELYVCR